MNCFHEGCTSEAELAPRVKEGPVAQFMRDGFRGREEQIRAAGLAYVSYRQFACCREHTTEAVAALKALRPAPIPKRLSDGRIEPPPELTIQLVPVITGRDLREAAVHPRVQAWRARRQNL